MKALITGGAGFIGTNLALRLSKENYHVIVLDNLSRRGTKENLKFLRKNISPSKFDFIKADIRVKNLGLHLKSDVIFHLAAQTAVTISVTDPKSDFDINAFGTFNLLENVRLYSPHSIFIYASTNKVYGALSTLKKIPAKGLNESTPLDFHSPYGVSKGVGEAYTRDYARIYGLKTVVFRQSCIYGPHQMGVEDQGWVAHIGARALVGKTVNVFGNGRQVRDLLYVDDLIDAYLTAIKKINKISGQVFNIGGGIKNAMSVSEYLEYLKKYTGKEIKPVKSQPRPGDQAFFVSDNSKIKKLLGWAPVTSYKNGLPVMLEWINANGKLFESFNK